jgi:hypothetical protein
MGPDGHFKLPHAGRTDDETSAVMAMRAAASLRRSLRRIELDAVAKFATRRLGESAWARIGHRAQCGQRNIGNSHLFPSDSDLFLPYRMEQAGSDISRRVVAVARQAVRLAGGGHTGVLADRAS